MRNRVCLRCFRFRLLRRQFLRLLLLMALFLDIILHACSQRRLQVHGIELVFHIDRLDLDGPGALLAHHLAVLFLLGSSQRLNLPLQLHGLAHILALAEPQNQVVALLHTLGKLTVLIIKLRQLVSPLLLIFPALILLQNRDLILQRRASALVNLILQHISAQIMGRNLHELLVKLHRLIVIFHPDRDLRHLVYNHTANGRAVISNIQNLIAVLKTFRIFVGFRHFHQKAHIADLSPVDGVRNLRRRLIIFPVQLLFQLFCLYLKFIFIQRYSPQLFPHILKL